MAALGVVAVHLALSAGMPGPFMTTDELGYLANARYLAGAEPAAQQPFSPFYSPGYSLLLVPLRSSTCEWISFVLRDRGAVGGEGDESGQAETPVIDVERLVGDIRRRAAAMRAAGRYPARLLDAPFDLDAGGAGPDADPLAAPIALRPERGYSSKPVVGPPITAVKRVAERLVHHVVQDGLDQAALRIEHVQRSLEDVERRMEERVDDLARGVRAASERDGRRLAELHDDLARALKRLDELSEAVESLERRLEDRNR